MSFPSLFKNNNFEYGSLALESETIYLEFSISIFYFH